VDIIGVRVMIEVTKRHDEVYPVSLRISRELDVKDGTVIRIGLKEARKLRMALSEAIDWAVNMEELRKENKKEKVVDFLKRR